jgi:hypothetical protein
MFNFVHVYKVTSFFRWQIGNKFSSCTRGNKVSFCYSKVQFLGRFTKLKKSTVSFVIYVCLYICPPTCNVTLIGHIFMKFDTSGFLKNLLRKLKFHYNLTRITGTFNIISCWVMYKRRNVADKSCTENQNTFYVQYISPENWVVCELMWTNMVQPDGPHNNITLCKKDALCMPNNSGKNTDTHTHNI